MNSPAKSVSTLTEGSLWKQMLLYFFPIFLGTCFQQLYNTADAIIVGKFVGKVALASVGGTSGNLISLLVNFFLGLSSGATVIIAQGCGSGDRKAIAQAVHTAMALAIAGGALLTVVGISVAGTALRMLNTPDEVYPLSKLYLIIYFCGMIPNLIYNVGSGILRAVGDSRRPLVFLVVTSFVNVGLDLLFVALLGMGVPGVALATVLSQAVSAVLVLIVLTRTEEAYHLSWKQIRFHLPTLKRIIAIGIPAGVQSTMYSVSNVLIQASINSFGTDVMAAWTAFTKLDSLNWAISGAYGTTVATFAGQSFGSGKYDRMRKVVRAGMLMQIITSICLSVAMFFGGKYAVRLFLDDPEPITYALRMIVLISTGYVFFVPIEIFSAACRSAGDSLRPMLLTASGICGYRILWICTVVARFHKMEVLFLCYPISWILTAVMFIVYYLRGNWLKRNIPA